MVDATKHTASRPELLHIFKFMFSLEVVGSILPLIHLLLVGIYHAEQRFPTYGARATNGFPEFFRCYSSKFGAFAVIEIFQLLN